ncbi:MAG: M14 metallopeptidase family protein [Bacteroidota bacterium]
MNQRFFTLALLFLFFNLSNFLQAQKVPSPEEVFGFRVGADYKLADYDQMLSYYQRLDEASDQVQMIEMGKSVTGLPIKLLFISTKENLAQLDRFKKISAALAKAQISPDEAETMVKEGKAVVWLDAGMHATERAGAQMATELAYKIATEETAEMQRIRENVITLLAPCLNPDGVDIVVDWYRKYLGTPFETSSPPILYQKYVGHDNNRDWFMNNMPETKAANRILYQEWFPQIIHNHHQPSPIWARIFLPPFRSPVNPRIHPGVTTAVNLVGTAMANRFAMKKMPGVISGTNFSMFWNGGMRTAPYYHNMIGILTEVAHTTPTPRFYDPTKKPKRVASMAADGSEIFYPNPWGGGESHFRDAVDYMITASMGVLEVAADRKEQFLRNIYLMGRDAIENTKEAYAYVIPAEQWDKGEARNLTEILQRGGLEAHRATNDFVIEGKRYTKGTIIFYGAQAFRPFLIDLLEKQEYPTQYLYPGGPPKPPYDLTGWTLPMQMGVHVDRIDEPFTTETELLKTLIAPLAGTIEDEGKAGYLLSAEENASYKAVNLALAQDLTVKRLVAQTTIEQTDYPAGTFWVAGDRATIRSIATQTGVTFVGVNKRIKTQTKRLQKFKLGIYKSWMANIDEGWSRWVFRQHAFDLDTLQDADIRRGNLEQYAAIVLPSQRPNRILHGHDISRMPREYTGGIGLEGSKMLNEYVKNGGTLITFDQASDFAIDQFDLPITNVTKHLSSKEFFIPGSLIRAKVDIEKSLAYGMQPEVATSFSRSRAFEIEAPSDIEEKINKNNRKAPSHKAKIIVQFADQGLLMSGWAQGEDQYLRGKAAMIDVAHGEGNVVLFGFRPQFRGQTRGTYKLIFNAIFKAAEGWKVSNSSEGMSSSEQ